MSGTPLSSAQRTSMTFTRTHDETALAIVCGADCFSSTRRALQNAIEQIEQWEALYAETPDLEQRANLVNQLIVQICEHLMPRLRLDRVADVQVMLRLAAARETKA
jgi:hypothetical protein